MLYSSIHEDAGHDGIAALLIERHGVALCAHFDHAERFRAADLLELFQHSSSYTVKSVFPQHAEPLELGGAMTLVRHTEGARRNAVNDSVKMSAPAADHVVFVPFQTFLHALLINEHLAANRLAYFQSIRVLNSDKLKIRQFGLLLTIN